MRFAAFALLLTAAAASAQPAGRDTLLRDDRNFSFYDRGPYRSSVPTPDALLGYPIGARNTQYAHQERTLLAIANAARDRVRVEEFAVTPELRTMRIYIVSSPENIARLDAIRADLDRIADPRGASQAELDAIVARTPAVVWISGSVHGNESPGFETAIQLLYQYAASEEPKTLETLRNSLVIINPSSNPDGHERFTVWYHSIAVADPNPGSVEHREPWSIQGRFNHYRFDMNRDLIAGTQREVRGIQRMMLRWHPMVAADLHGHVTSYFFPPAARPVNARIGPEADKWLEAIGQGAAAGFDRYGWMYYSRDVFDLYYPGYYDTWPSLNGAIGMTFETDGGGHRGLLWRRPDGSYVSMRDGVAKHYVASVATIETTAGRRAERVADYLAFRQRAVAEGRSDAMKRVVLVPGRDPARAEELARTLLQQGIEVHQLTAPLTSTATAYADGRSASRRFEPGAFVVDLAQPQGRLARAILEPSPTLDTAFARTQVERFRRNLRRAGGAAEGYEFYDITAWTLPRAFGVESYWTTDAPALGARRLANPSTAPGADTSALMWPGFITTFPRGVTGGPARSAYLYSSETNGAARLTYRLLAEGYRVSVAADSIDAGGRRWPRGSYVVRVARNDSTLHRRIASLSDSVGVAVAAVNSAFTSGGGQYGIGSEVMVDLPRPSIAVVGDEGISQPSYGAVWYTFEQRYGMQFTPIGWSYIAGGDLSRFTAIVIPSGGVGGRITGGALERLKSWIQNGGTLVTMGNASSWASSEAAGLTTARRVGSDDTGSTRSGAAASSTATPATAAPTAARPDTSGQRTGNTPDRLAEELIPFRSPSASDKSPEAVPGAEFDVLLDRTHWLTFGYPDQRLTVLLDGNLFLKPSRNGVNVGVFPSSGALHRAGFIWPDNTERLLRGTSFLIDEPIGGGHLVLFTNEPFFRGWWRALDKMVMNAVLLGPAF